MLRLGRAGRLGPYGLVALDAVVASFARVRLPTTRTLREAGHESVHGPGLVGFKMADYLKEHVRRTVIPWPNGEVDELAVDPDGEALVSKVRPVVVGRNPDLPPLYDETGKLAEVAK
jgi:hypothetical protein